MNRILAPILLALTFTVMFSSSSFAGWTKASENVDGDIYYVDFERIRKVDGFIYWWTLTDYPKPTPFWILSQKKYRQGDCKLFRFKDLSVSFHEVPMGGGTGDVQEPVKKGWTYPPPDSDVETILKPVCAYVK